MIDADRYTYRVTWSEEDAEFIGLCAEFPSLSHLAGNRSEALEGIVALVQAVLAEMAASGEAAPEPLSAHRFSGKFQVRIPPQVHRMLAVQAAEAGVSLNRYVSAKLSAS